MGDEPLRVIDYKDVYEIANLPGDPGPVGKWTEEIQKLAWAIEPNPS